MSQPPSSPDDPTRAGQGPYGDQAPQNSPYQPPSYPTPPTHQPYGGSPPQPPGYGANPYGQGYPQNPYGPQPPGSKSGSKTTLWVVVIIVAVIVLVCGGFIGLGVWAFSSISDEIESSDGPGTKGNPITLTEGEAFDIEDFTYDEGWQITGDDFSDEITGLIATNDGDESDDVSLTFTFLDGTTELGQITCRSSGDIADGNNEELDCSGYDLIGEFESIEVENTYENY